MTCTHGSKDDCPRRLPAILMVAALVGCHGDATEGSPTPGPTPPEHTPPAGGVSLAPGAVLQDSVSKYPDGTFFVMGSGAYPFQSSTPKSGMSFQGEAGR